MPTGTLREPRDKQRTKSHTNRQTEIQLKICVTGKKHTANQNTCENLFESSFSTNTSNYTGATVKKRVRNRWLKLSIVRNWNFVETRQIKSLIGFTRLGSAGTAVRVGWKYRHSNATSIKKSQERK